MKTNISSANQEIPGIWWNQKVHHHLHNDLLPVAILSQIKSIPTQL
jgi:hypothetical protein